MVSKARLDFVERIGGCGAERVCESRVLSDRVILFDLQRGGEGEDLVGDLPDALFAHSREWIQEECAERVGDGVGELIRRGLDAQRGQQQLAHEGNVGPVDV